MSERRIQIIGSIPLPASLAESGKLQTRVGEAVEAFAAELKKLGIPGEMECKVVSARPKKVNGPVEQRQAPAVPAALAQEPVDEVQDQQPTPTPPWAKQ